MNSSAYEQMFAASLYGSSEKHIRVVERFLDQHCSEAQRLGWSDVNLFGCYSNRRFVAVRYDAMGAVTVAAFTGQAIISVSEMTLRLANNLSARGPASIHIATPVWSVFSDSANGHS